MFEVWESPDHARKHSENNTPAIGEFKMPPPDRVAGFEPTVYLSRAGTEQ